MQKQKNFDMSWNCVVVARRVMCGKEEALVQWDCSWVDADIVPEGRVVEVLLRRTVRGQNQMLVQWACTWELVELVDEGALAEFDGPVDEVLVAPGPVSQAIVADKTKSSSKKRKNHGW
jgi:hypothetical protein